MASVIRPAPAALAASAAAVCMVVAGCGSSTKGADNGPVPTTAAVSTLDLSGCGVFGFQPMRPIRAVPGQAVGSSPVAAITAAEAPSSWLGLSAPSLPSGVWSQAGGSDDVLTYAHVTGTKVDYEVTVERLSDGSGWTVGSSSPCD